MKEGERETGDEERRYLREREVVCWVAELVIAGGGGCGLGMEWRRTRAGGLQVIDSYPSGSQSALRHNAKFRTCKKRSYLCARVNWADNKKVDEVEGIVTSATPADISYLNHMTLSSSIFPTVARPLSARPTCLLANESLCAGRAEQPVAPI